MGTMAQLEHMYTMTHVQHAPQLCNAGYSIALCTCIAFCHTFQFYSALLFWALCKSTVYCDFSASQDHCRKWTRPKNT